MKKLFLFCALMMGMVSITGQMYKPLKKLKKSKEDFLITINENQKDKIDWTQIQEFFADRKENDSIHISVKLNLQKDKNIKSETKYTVSGIKKNLNQLISLLKKQVQ